MATFDQTDVIAFLSTPRAFPQNQEQVQRIDTHISCVFLAGRVVYKLKKQLQFDFLDYSTLDRRRWACEQEVALNRRLAPQVYQGVVPVTHDGNGRFVINGTGEVAEWLVQMQRLPDSATLLHHIQHGTATAHQIVALGQMLGEFYRDQIVPPSAVAYEASANQYLRHLRNHITGNLAELAKNPLEADSQMVADVHGLQLRMLNLCPQLFAARVHAGLVVDGHGDLRPEHIYFLPDPVIIDCIEFNAEFRQVDVLDELAFLAVECERLGAEWIGQQLLADGIAMGDGPPDQLLIDFYSSYRACVRAKVHCLRTRQLPEQEVVESRRSALSYLELAARHAQQLVRSLLVIVYGLSGTGKSTFATALGKSLNFNVLSTDVLRKKLMGNTTAAERYKPENRQQVYQALLEGASERLTAGESLVVDGTFAQRDVRQQANEVAQRNHAMVLFVHCQCTEEVALSRIATRLQERTSPSEATANVYHQQAESFESDQELSAPIVTINTERELEANLADVKKILFPCEDGTLR